MPEHLRALVIIIFLASITFFVARRATIDFIPSNQLVRWRNMWLSLTVLAFISHSIWVYFVIASLVLFITAPQEKNRVALFLLILFLIPNASVTIPGFGLVNYIFELTHVRFLTITILLPAAFLLQSQQGTLRFGRLWPDRILAIYLLVSSALLFRDPSITAASRDVVGLIIDVFLPYYVISRFAINYKTSFEAIVAFVIATVLLAVIGIFEYLRHWLLYSALVKSMGLEWGLGGYLGRSGSLRAVATSGQAIALGYVIAVGMGLYLFVKDNISNKNINRLVATILIIGLVATISRGPWVGALVIVTIFIASGSNGKGRLVNFGFVMLMLLLITSQFETGKRLLDYLPFIGSIEKGNIDYRQRLLDNAMIVIERNPWLGSTDYHKSKEMLSMIQGQGIIDIVNTYLGIALDKGIVGLSLFLFFFASVLLGVHRALCELSKDDDMRRLGRSLFATLIGILVMIFTVSSISIIPVVYWSVAGLGVAYMQMVAQRKISSDQLVPKETLHK